jgi:hypothetical protein
MVPFLKLRPDLKQLSLEACPGNGISNESIDALAAHCQGLTSLTLSDSPMALDVSPIVRACANLNNLSVTSCPNLDSECLLSAIVTYGAAIRDLNVEGSNVSAHRAVQFLMQCRTLDSFAYGEGH